MAYRIVIRFEVEAGLHRIRNFGEALFGELPGIDGTLSIAQVDATVDRLDVTDVHSRTLKRLLSRIEKLLAEHGLKADVSADREPAS